MRPPLNLNLSRLRYHPQSQLIFYEPKAGQAVDDEAPLDPLEFLARVLIHIPEPNKHLVRPARTSLLAEPRIDGGSVLTSRSSFAATALLSVWVALALDPPFLFPRYFL